MKPRHHHRTLPGPWRIEGSGRHGLAGAVVIPALAEGRNLSATLRSLAQNPPELLSRFLILVVVNHRPDASTEDKADNLATLSALRSSGDLADSLNLAWVNAASPGYELPAKKGGVGLARRIGLELALERLADSPPDPLLVCLDADTLVRPDYLAAIVRHFEQTDCGGAIIHFRHQPAPTAAEQAAIDRYELFLRCYVLGLQRAGSPYGFHTVGSAMACRASAYHRCGGMNSRAAGEDFYFLQQLYRTCGVAQVNGTVVYPSPRSSHRVPFGTGRSVSNMLDGGEGELLFYRCECYRELGGMLAAITRNPAGTGLQLVGRVAESSALLGEYLEEQGFPEVWDKLQRNHPSVPALLKAFHDWFDGLKTMKLIHHLSATAYPRCEPQTAVPGLLDWAGLAAVDGTIGQLELLRRHQLGGDSEST